MLRFIAPLLIFLSLAAANLFGAGPAHAVIKGTSSSLGSYTVRLTGSGYCSGVVIARRAVATAAHCARGMRVLSGGGSVKVVGISRSAVLDDGRRVSVSGDAAILLLASPLSHGAAPVGEGGGDTFTIAGYGTVDERERGAFGSLHEASLVAASAHALVDPNRTGSIGASACFGDSGGPVMRGGMLVGIITRAAHPSPRIACGHLTRWAPIIASGEAGTVAMIEESTTPAEPRGRKTRRHARSHHQTQTASLFGNWFAPKIEAQRASRRKQAQR